MSDIVSTSSCICVLCKISKSTVSLGELTQIQLPKSNKSIWCHVNCSELSPLTEKKGIAYEAKRGEGLTCIVCKKRGATVGCTLADCERSYHVQSAANVGARFDVVRHVLGEGGLFCEKHCTHIDAASASSAGPGNNAATWAEESRICRKGRDRASALENANDSTLLADELLIKRRKMMELAMSISGAMGKRCGVCNCGFRITEGRFAHGPPAANAHHTNPLSRDPAHLASSLFLTEEAVGELAIWHPLAGGQGRSDHSSAPSGFGPDLKDDNDETSDDDGDEEGIDDDDDDEKNEKKKQKLEIRRKAILRAANISSNVSSSLNTADSNQKEKQKSDLNFDEEFSGADVFGVNSVTTGDYIPSFGMQGGASSPNLTRQLRRRAIDSSSSLSDLRPIKEACASPDDAGRADDGSWWLAGAPLSCTDCGILVHAACYGISFSIAEQLLNSYLASSSANGEEQGDGVLRWACDSCRFIEKEKPPSSVVKCVLCPNVNTNGESKSASKGEVVVTTSSSTALPLKRCTVIKAIPNNNKLAFPHISLKQSIKGKWVHLCCALWHHEESSVKLIMAEDNEEMDGDLIGGKKGEKQYTQSTDQRSSRVSVSIGDLSKLTGIVVTVSDPEYMDGSTDIVSSSSMLTSDTSQVSVISKFPCSICQSSTGATIPLAVRGSGRGSDTRSHVHASCAIHAMWHTELWAPVPPPAIITTSTKRRTERGAGTKVDTVQTLAFPLSLSVPALTTIRDGGVAIFHPSSSPVASFCICREPDDGSLMVECDVCRNWFHARCVGINPKRVKTKEEDKGENGQMLGELEDAFACAACFSKGGVPDKAIIAANLQNAEMANLPLRPSYANQLIPPSVIIGNELVEADSDADLAEDDENISDSPEVEETELDDKESSSGKVTKSTSSKRSKNKKSKTKADTTSKGSTKRSGITSSSDSLVKLQVRGGNSKGNDLLTFLTPFNLYHLRTWARACDSLLGQARDASGVSLLSQATRPTAHSALSLLVGFHSIYVPFAIASRSRSSTLAYLLQVASLATPRSNETKIVLDRLFKILMQTSLYDNLLAIGTRVQHTKEFCYGYIDNLITVMIEEKGRDTHEICQYMVKFDGDRDARQTRCDLVERVQEGNFAETANSNSAQHKSNVNLVIHRNAYYYPPSTADGCRAITSAGIRFLLEELDNSTNFAKALIIALPQSPMVGGLLPLELLMSAYAKFLSIANKALDSSEEHIISISLRNAGIIDESVLYTVDSAQGYTAALILIDAVLKNEKNLPLSAPSTLLSRALSLKALVKWLQDVELLSPLKGASEGKESSQVIEYENTDTVDNIQTTNSSISSSVLKTSLSETVKVVSSFHAATESDVTAWVKWHNTHAGDLHQVLALFADATRPGLIRSAICDLAMRYGVSVDNSETIDIDDKKEIEGFVDFGNKLSDDIDAIIIDDILTNQGGDMLHKSKKSISQQTVWPPGSLTFKKLYADGQTVSSKAPTKKSRAISETLEVLPGDEELAPPLPTRSSIDGNGRRISSRRAAMEATAAEKASKQASSSSVFASSKLGAKDPDIFDALPDLGCAPREWSFFTLPVGGVKSSSGDFPAMSRSACATSVLSNLHRHPLRSVALLCRIARAANSWLQSAKKSVPELNPSKLVYTINADVLELEEEDEENSVEEEETLDLSSESSQSLTSSSSQSGTNLFFPSLSVPSVASSKLVQLSKIARAWQLTCPRLITAEGLIFVSKKWDSKVKLAISRAESSAESSSTNPLIELISLCSVGKKLPVHLKMKETAFEIADRLSWHDRASKVISNAKSGSDKRPKLKIVKSLILQADISRSSTAASHFSEQLVSQLRQLELDANLHTKDVLLYTSSLSAEAVHSIEKILEITGGSEARITDSTSASTQLLQTLNLIEVHTNIEKNTLLQRLKTLQSLSLVISEEEAIIDRIVILDWTLNVAIRQLKAAFILRNGDEVDKFYDLVCAGLGSKEKLQRESMHSSVTLLQQRHLHKKMPKKNHLSFIPEVYKKADQILGLSEPTEAMLKALQLLLREETEKDEMLIGFDDEEEDINLNDFQSQSSVSLQLQNSSSMLSPPIVSAVTAIILSRFIALALLWRKSASILNKKALSASTLTTSTSNLKLLKPSDVFLHRSALISVLNSVLAIPTSSVYSSFNELYTKLDSLKAAANSLIDSVPSSNLEITSNNLFSLIEKNGKSKCATIIAAFLSAGFEPTLELAAFQKALQPLVCLSESTRALEYILCQDESIDEEIRVIELQKRAQESLQYSDEINNIITSKLETFVSGFWSSIAFTLERYAKYLCASSQLLATYANANREDKTNTLLSNGFFSTPFTEISIWNISTETLLSAIKLLKHRDGIGSNSILSSASTASVKAALQNVLVFTSTLNEKDRRRCANGFFELDVSNISLRSENDRRKTHVENLLSLTLSSGLDQVLKQLQDPNSVVSLVTLQAKIQEASKCPIQSPFLAPVTSVLADIILSKRAKDFAIQLSAALQSDALTSVVDNSETMKKLELSSLEDVEVSCARLISYSEKNDMDNSSSLFPIYQASDALQSAHLDLKAALNDISTWRKDAEMLLSSTGFSLPTPISTPEKLLQSPLLKVISIPLAARLSAAHRETMQWTQRAEKIIPIALSAINTAMKAVLPASLGQQQQLQQQQSNSNATSSSTLKGQSSLSGSTNNDSTFIASFYAEQRLRNLSKELAILSIQASRYVSSDSITKFDSANSSVTANYISAFGRSSLWWLSAREVVGNVSFEKTTEESSLSIETVPSSSIVSSHSRQVPFLVLPPAKHLLDSIIQAIRQSDGILNMRHALGLSVPEDIHSGSKDIQSNSIAAYFLSLREFLKPRVTVTALLALIAKLQALGLGGEESPPMLIQSALSAVNAANSFSTRAFTGLSGTDEPALALINTYLVNHANPNQDQSSINASSSSSLSTSVQQPLSQTLYAPQVTCDNVVDFLEAQIAYLDHKISKTGPWSYLSIAGIDNAVDEFDKSIGRGSSAAVVTSRDGSSKHIKDESLSVAVDPTSEALILSRINRRKRIKWAKIRGFPFWPASLVSSSTILSMSPPLGGEAVLKQKQTKPNNFIMVKFFGSHPAMSTEFLLASTGMAPASVGGSTNYAWIRRPLVRPWGRGPNSQDCPNLHPIFVPSFVEAVRLAVSAVEDTGSEITRLHTSNATISSPPLPLLKDQDQGLEMTADGSVSTVTPLVESLEPKLSDFSHLPASSRIMAFVKAKAAYNKRGSVLNLSNSASFAAASTSSHRQNMSLSLSPQIASAEEEYNAINLPMSLSLGMAPTPASKEFVTKIRTQVEEEFKKALSNTLRGATVSNLESLLNSTGPNHSPAIVYAAQASVQWTTDLIARRSSEIEASLFARYLFGADAVKQQEYGQKFREIVAVLRLSEMKDGAPTGSASFRKKVISGNIRPFQLSRMNASELAAELKSCASIDKKDAENEKQKLNLTSVSKVATTSTSSSSIASNMNPPARTLVASAGSSAGIESTTQKSTTSLLFKAAGISKPSQQSLNTAGLSIAPKTDNIIVRSLHKRNDLASVEIEEVDLTAKKQKMSTEIESMTSSTPLLTTSSLSEYLAQARVKAISTESDDEATEKEIKSDINPSQQSTDSDSHFDVRLTTASYTFSASFNASTSEPIVPNKVPEEHNTDANINDARRLKRPLLSPSLALGASSISTSSSAVVKKQRIDSSSSEQQKSSQELTPYTGVQHSFELSGVYKRNTPQPDGKIDITVTAIRCSFIASAGEAGFTEKPHDCNPNFLMQQLSPFLFSPAKLVGRMQSDSSEKGFLSHLSAIDAAHAKREPSEKRAMCAFKLSIDNESFREFLLSLAMDNRVGVVRFDKERDEIMNPGGLDSKGANNIALSLSKCFVYIIPPLSFFTTNQIDLIRAMNGEGKAGFLSRCLGIRNDRQSSESAFAVLEYRPDNYPSKFTQKRNTAYSVQRSALPALLQSKDSYPQRQDSSASQNMAVSVVQAPFQPQVQSFAQPSSQPQVHSFVQPSFQPQVQPATQSANIVSSEVASAIAQVNRFPTPYMDAVTLQFFNEAVSKCREPAAPISAVIVMQGQMKGNPAHMKNYSFLLPDSPLYAYFLARVGGGGYYLDEIGIKALSGAPSPQSNLSVAPAVAPPQPAFNIQTLLERATKPASATTTIPTVPMGVASVQTSFVPVNNFSFPIPQAHTAVAPAMLPAAMTAMPAKPLEALSQSVAPSVAPVAPVVPSLAQSSAARMSSGRGDDRTRPAWMR